MGSSMLTLIESYQLFTDWSSSANLPAQKAGLLKAFFFFFFLFVFVLLCFCFCVFVKGP